MYACLWLTQGTCHGFSNVYDDGEKFMLVNDLVNRLTGRLVGKDHGIDRTSALSYLDLR